MSRRAQVDVVVERARLRKPGAKREVRLDLYNKLATLGHIDSIERYVAEPPDGPFNDGTIAAKRDRDPARYVVIRLIGYVTPYVRA